ncbi:MAG: hypothetical protein VB078_00535 [Clostridiaceae bacterium]|nr:hypothetical protein [Clostridiaceae bacterium]
MNTNKEMPLGLKMALTQNMAALNSFAMLSDSDQALFIENSKQMRSKQDMQAYVCNLLQA